MHGTEATLALGRRARVACAWASGRSARSGVRAVEDGDKADHRLQLGLPSLRTMLAGDVDVASCDRREIDRWRGVMLLMKMIRKLHLLLS
uniref:Uncharacterized protein n=1 Tax=Oryza sativa subsp. japonica TaxID=39947 RepID=Q6EPF8_ORYSJ|nr:hypothetical protein [Oryza sativa Japonica Group]